MIMRPGVGPSLLSISGSGYGNPLSTSVSTPLLNPRPTPKAKPSYNKNQQPRRSSSANILTLNQTKPGNARSPRPLLPPLAKGPIQEVPVKKSGLPKMPNSSNSRPSSAASKTKPKKATKKLGPLTRARNAWDDSYRMDAVRSMIVIKYSHYCDKFEARDGVVRWSDIDERYCISTVFPGKFKRHIVHGNKWAAEEAREDKVVADFFLGFDPSQEKEYLLKVEEDPKHRTENPTRTYRASAGVKGLVGSGGTGKAQASLITDDLKNMTSEQLKEGGEEYKRMIEARDVEELLFSG